MIFIKNDTLVKRVFRTFYICYIKLFANVWICSSAFFYLFFYQNRTKHKKRKISLETQAVLLIFSFELGISGVAIQKINQNSKKWLLPVNIFSVKMTLRNYLTTFCCYYYGANCSEAFEKITTD